MRDLPVPSGSTARSPDGAIGGAFACPMAYSGDRHGPPWINLDEYDRACALTTMRSVSRHTEAEEAKPSGCRKTVAARERDLPATSNGAATGRLTLKARIATAQEPIPMTGRGL